MITKITFILLSLQTKFKLIEFHMYGIYYDSIDEKKKRERERKTINNLYNLFLNQIKKKRFYDYYFFVIFAGVFHCRSIIGIINIKENSSFFFSFQN